MSDVIVLRAGSPRTLYDEVALFDKALSASQIADLYAARPVDYTADPQVNAGWEEVFGPEQPLTPVEVPVIANGMARVRWNGAVRAFTVDAYIAGLGYFEMGRVSVFHDDGAGWVQHGQLEFAAVVAQTHEQATLRVTTTVISGTTVNRLDTYITMTRGVPGPRFEVYPAPRADGTKRGTQIRFTHANGSDPLWLHMRGAILRTSDHEWTDAENLGTGAVFASFMGGLRGITIATQRNGVEYRIYNDTVAYGAARKAAAICAPIGGAMAGYCSAHVMFTPPGPMPEAEGHRNTASTTATTVAEAGVGGGSAVNDTQTTQAANTLLLRSAAIGLAPGVYGLWARVRVTTAGDTLQVAGGFQGAGNSAAGSVTSTSTTYVWVNLGETTLAAPLASGNDFYFNIWRSAGTGTTGVRVDRIALVPLDFRQSGSASYNGARDLAVAQLYDARSVPELVTR